MVSIRSSHFSRSHNTDPTKWITTLGLVDDDQKKLLHNYYKILPLCVDKGDIQLLQRGIQIIEILVTLNMDIDTLNAALIFPLLAHHHILTQEQVEENWGKRVSKLVKYSTEMEGIRVFHGQNASEIAPSQIANLRHMLLAMVGDIRAVVIKLAERVCYMREIRNEDNLTKVTAANEVSAIYAPLANRLGIGQLKWELEDLAFFYQQPEAYKKIVHLLAQKRKDRENYIKQFIDDVEILLKDIQIDGHVYGRPKHIYSIYRKLQKKELKFDELFDIRAVRIIVDGIEGCYAILGAVHSKFNHISSEFVDYIAKPKANGYQSIHSIVLGKTEKPIEVQIRTRQMHHDAELGVAAHWKYKESSPGGKAATGYEEKIIWLRKILAWQKDIAKSNGTLDAMRDQIFNDRVYVFTPDGDVIDLPTGSTPLDFAYYIHSQIGHRCIGAKVAKNIVPFSYQLKTGDQVEILTQKEPMPRRDWLNPNLGYINAPRARLKVALWFKKQDRQKNVIAGRDLLEDELAKVQLNIKDATPAIDRFNAHCLDDIFAGIGCGDLRINQIIHFLDDHYHKKTPDQLDLAALESIGKRSKKKQDKKNVNIIIDGVDNVLHSIARCCQPIPDEPIKGYITQGRGISIHRESCLQLEDLIEAHPERLICATWGNISTAGYSLMLRLGSIDRSGLLKDITTLFANENLNLLGVHSITNVKDHYVTIDLNIEVNNSEIISPLLIKLRKIKDVMDVRRL